MRTHQDGKPIHPGDLLEDFRGRIAVFDALGSAAISADHAGAHSLDTSPELGRALVALAEDFNLMRVAINEWLERERNGGARR